MKEIRRPIFSIGVAGNLVGLPPATIRRWERAGLVAPARGATGWRMFSWQDIAALQRARELDRRGVGLEDIRRRLHRKRPVAAGVQGRKEVAAAPALRRLSPGIERGRQAILALPVAVQRA